MKKRTAFVRHLAYILLFTFLFSPAPSRAAQQTVDWAWLESQVASGVEKITLPGPIAFEEGGILHIEGTLTIEGQGFALRGAAFEGGTVYLKDIVLEGIHGLNDENGGAALTLRGEGAIAVISGLSRVIGGRSGPDGESGGDGILMADAKQGVILRNSALVQGGMGRILGGAGIRVAACAGSVLMTNEAAAMGSAGLAEGGAGINAPGCAKLSLGKQSSAVGGSSVYLGGDGIHSMLCEVCGKGEAVSLRDEATLTSGLGQDGGNAIHITRDAPGETPDLSIAGNCMLIGGAGGTAGAAIRASNVLIFAEDEPTLFGGNYYEQETPILSLENCEQAGDMGGAEQLGGAKLERHPASDMSLIINHELSLVNDRYVPTPIEDGLATRELATKYEGHTVDRGKVNQAKITGNSLKIVMWDGTREHRLSFYQRLGGDGGSGTRLALLSDSSHEWLIVESTVAALRKLLSLGITQLAYTSMPPAYLERIIDIEALLKAVDASEDPVEQIALGTADDCVIFIGEKGVRSYQESLMADIVRPLEPLPVAEEQTEAGA